MKKWELRKHTPTICLQSVSKLDGLLFGRKFPNLHLVKYLPVVAVKLGKKHPDPVVETASLSSVEPTDVWYDLSLPESTINSGALSALQLEAITYASQQHEQLLPDGSRAGFLIGGLEFERM
mgnify:CR=1 FL=1